MTDHLLNAAQAARVLNVSTKALRVYERQGLLKPRRNAADWRFYGAAEMERGQKIVALRGLGMSLARIKAVLAGSADAFDALLAAHQAELDRQMTDIAAKLAALQALRQRRANGAISAADAAAEFLLDDSRPSVSLALPWPWAGEMFAIDRLGPVTFLTGPLGSGKTRLAEALAKAISGARFVGLDRSAGVVSGDPAVQQAVLPMLTWLREDGAVESDALLALLGAMACEPATVLVIDLIEDGLDEATQDALGAWLRRHDGRPLIVMTRSSAILDLDDAGRRMPVIHCPANHSLPAVVIPVPGAVGFEAVASCLAAPEVRMRTAGVRVVRG
jgi:DNA-binding transcriptional MerR regulator